MSKNSELVKKACKKVTIHNSIKLSHNCPLKDKRVQRSLAQDTTKFQAVSIHDPLRSEFEVKLIDRATKSFHSKLGRENCKDKNGHIHSPVRDHHILYYTSSLSSAQSVITIYSGIADSFTAHERSTKRRGVRGWPRIRVWYCLGFYLPLIEIPRNIVWLI